MYSLILTNLEFEGTEGHVQKMLVSSATSSEARLLASENAGEEGPDVWLEPSRSTCITLKPMPMPAVMMQQKA